MVDEVVEAVPKAKKPILLIVGGIVVLLLLVVGAVVGTLFVTGFFKPAPVLTAEQMLEGDSQAATVPDARGGPAKAGGKDAAPVKQSKKSPELTRFDFSYLKLEGDFLSNLTGSRKVMSVQIAVMTRYDQRVFDNVKKHEMALRSVILDVMRQTVEADLGKPEFRKDLAVRIRDAMNTMLEKYEDFGGIEELYFTTFVTQ
jgi:flagellar FliL protein